MADIRLAREHSFTAEQAEEMIQELADKLVSKHGGSYTWEGHTVHYKTTGVSASVSNRDQEVMVKVTLGLFMKGLRPLLENEIRTYLDTHVS
ncbi:MAG: polyhydroxyalkanoic acid system family protein [bacterium]